MDQKLQEIANQFVAFLKPLIKESAKEAFAELMPVIPKPEMKPEPELEPSTVDPKITQIWHLDFQNVPLEGTEKKEQFKKAFNNQGSIEKVGDWWFEKIAGKTLFRTRIKKGLVGSDLTGVNGWADSHTDPKNPEQGHQELFLRYVFIPRGPKEWGLGSKLPGPVVGGFGNEGPFNSGGTNNPAAGGSARLMMKGDRWLYPYIYAHNEKGTMWGTDGGAGRIAQAVLNERNVIDMRVVMNTKSNADGIFQIWHQGKLVCTLTNLIWQLEGNKSKGWNKLSIGSFNGGDSPAFIMNEEAGVDFEEFQVGYGENPKKVYKETDLIEVFGKILGGK